MGLKIDWYYHRNGCVTCGRSLDFLNEHDAKIVEQTSANKERYSPAEALKIVRQATQLWVAKGKKVVHINLAKDQPSDDELTQLIIGPSGKLRAPVIRKGTKLFIGFNPEGFAEPLVGKA